MAHQNSRVWFSRHPVFNSRSLSVSNKYVTVTGCSQGIGRALVDAILAANERVVATLRKPEVLASYAEKYPSSQLLILPLDVTSDQQIDAAFAKVKEHFGRLDVVVNNAGYGIVSEIEGVPEADARVCFDVCFWGPLRICQRVRCFQASTGCSVADLCVWH